MENLAELSDFKWGLLVPICCTDKEHVQVCWDQLKVFATTLEETTNQKDRDLMQIHVGINENDFAYDSDSAKAKLTRLFTEIGINEDNIYIRMFTVGYRGTTTTVLLVLVLHFIFFCHSGLFRDPSLWRRDIYNNYLGKICWIWNDLAQAAIEAGSDFFVLLGDDIQLQSQGWKNEIEEQFRYIAQSRNLPFGVGCVAFRDDAFPVFPTFPVLHRVHFEIYGKIFPSMFVNQDGDPFLWEIYRRFAASHFSPSASLSNTVGGRGKARYTKYSCLWRNHYLTEAISTLSRWLGVHEGKAMCLDVVAPTFRCDVKVLRDIVNLNVSTLASVSFLLVVDDPLCPHLEEVKALVKTSISTACSVFSLLTTMSITHYSYP